MKFLMLTASCILGLSLGYSDRAMACGDHDTGCRDEPAEQTCQPQQKVGEGCKEGSNGSGIVTYEYRRLCQTFDGCGNQTGNWYEFSTEVASDQWSVSCDY